MPEDRGGGDRDKKTVLFNQTKRETHGPNAGFKKLARRLKASFRVGSNKDEISRDRLADSQLVVFGGSRDPFSTLEFAELKAWLGAGGRCLICLGEGGERQKLNLNYLLEEYGMSVNNDSVLRTVFHKYLHPKEVFVSDGVLVPDLARNKVLALQYLARLVSQVWRRTRRAAAGGPRASLARPLRAAAGQVLTDQAAATSWRSCSRTAPRSKCSAPPTHCSPPAR